jgi:hypothetical protein
MPVSRVPTCQRGFALIVAIVLIVVGAILASAMAFMVSSSGSTASDNLQSGQGLFLAESGIEYESRRMAQNVDWYRASADPFDSSTQNFGQGSFTVSVNLPATELSRRMTTAAAPLTINVFAGGNANRWLAAGTLLIDDFSGTPEFVTYNPTTATTFTVTTRNVTVGTVIGSLAAHSRRDPVYPVTTLGVALVAVCATVPNPFTIAANSKFLSAGTITVFHNNGVTIDQEQITYAGTSTVGATTTLLGVQRCQNGTAGFLASIGDPVAPLVSNVGTNDFEIGVSSTGTVGSAQRQAFKAVQRAGP